MRDRWLVVTKKNQVYDGVNLSKINLFTRSLKDIELYEFRYTAHGRGKVCSDTSVTDEVVGV